MNRALVVAPLVVAVLFLAGSATGAGPSPGVTFGSPGVLSHDGKLRYVALRAGPGTVVAAVKTRGGAVQRTHYLQGIFGVPLVAYDGTTGGLARNGKRLVVYAPSRDDSRPVTRFAVLDPGTLRVRKRIALKGDFGFDALSPDGSILYLIQLRRDPSAADYDVRALDVNTGRLYPGSIVDRREPAEKMTGLPMARVGSGDGGWAYTLYTRPEKAPFVHALNTTRRRAFCIDLPLRVSANDLGRVRMRLGNGMLVLRLAGRTLATIDTRTFHVIRP